jgi:hypothetical protein
VQKNGKTFVTKAFQITPEAEIKFDTLKAELKNTNGPKLIA